MTDPNPDVKIPAIKRAVNESNPDAQRQLVRDLESDDPAVRFYAIYALEKMAGSRMGYEYFGEERQRRAAVVRWQQWLKQQDQESTGAASGAF